MIQNLKFSLIGFIVGAALVSSLQIFKKPDKESSKASDKESAKASGASVGLQLASKKSKKSTKPNGASKEEVVETYVSVDAGAYDANSKKEAKSSSEVEHNFFNFYIGGGANLNLKNPNPRGSLLGTYDMWAGQIISNGKDDHSIFGHVRLLTW